MAGAIVVLRAETLPLVVVINDDSEDDELISLTAEAGTCQRPAITASGRT